MFLVEFVQRLVTLSDDYYNISLNTKQFLYKFHQIMLQFLVEFVQKLVTFSDDYYNVSLDTTFAMKFAVETPNLNPDFLVISDDDSFVNLPKFHQAFVEEKAVSPVSIASIDICPWRQRQFNILST